VNKDDIKSLTRIGRSLWGDTLRSVAMSEDTLTSVSLLNLSDVHTIERASRVMIERAEKNPPNLLKLNHPFFRMAPIERFLLTALHLEKWSYDRVARTLGIEAELIPTWAWATRLKYCFQELEADVDYPHGPASLGPVCPEYNPSAPWSQKFLDDELGKRERLFLQNHLMACDRCRKTLELTRKTFFKIESLIPVKEVSQTIEESNEQLFETWKAGLSTFRPITVKTSESLAKFIAQPHIQLVMAGLLMFIFYWITRSPHA
jgi:hypothetical protein